MHEEEWDGPLSLKDMIVEMPEEINNIFSNYTMNLVQVRDSRDYIFHNEDVKTVFEISESIFKKDFKKLQKDYGNKDIAAELIRVIGKITETTGLIHQVKNEEVMNMCTALEELVEEGVQRGMQEGAEKNTLMIITKLLGKGFKPENVADMLDVELSKVLEVRR